VLILSLIFCKQEEKLLFFRSISGCTCLILFCKQEEKLLFFRSVSGCTCLILLVGNPEESQ
jgi:hypothetical protein